MGAAIAQLTSMDLIKAGIPITSLYNFGQPRLGDQKYAAFANSKVHCTLYSNNNCNRTTIATIVVLLALVGSIKYFVYDDME